MEIQRKVRKFQAGCPKVKVLPFFRFNLMISVSTEMLYQEVRDEISLGSELVWKNQGRCKSKKVATLSQKEQCGCIQNFQTGLLQFYAQTYSGQIKIYHCRNYLISLCFVTESKPTRKILFRFKENLHVE